MSEIKLREDILGQYINATSNTTFQQLQGNYNIMQKQLQAYKDKENKLRELISDGYKIYETLTNECLSVQWVKLKDILQILNEGSDGNE